MANSIPLIPLEDLPLNILNLDGTLNDEVPPSYRGLKIKDARKKIIKEMEDLTLLDKIKSHKNIVPRGDRSNSILEPLITTLWFLDVDQNLYSKPAFIIDGEVAWGATANIIVNFFKKIGYKINQYG